MKTFKYISCILLLFVFLTKSQSKTWLIEASDYSFSPASLTVSVGDTIVWKYTGGKKHTTTSTTIPSGAEQWDAPLFTSSPTFTYVVTVKGTYNYVCTPHVDMDMTGTFEAR